MCSHGGARAAGRSTLEVGEIFRQHGSIYRQRHSLTPEQLRVMRDIETCRTAVRGGCLDTCDHCGHQLQAYASCGNRHCPKCQALHQAKWIHQRIARILAVLHFHIVFTLPKQLRSLVLCNRKVLYDLLFKTASETLLQLGQNPKRLGAQLGLTAVLHTWTRQLEYHPHLHCVVTAGGLQAADDRWVDSDPDFLLSVRVMSRLFRGKFLGALQDLYDRGQLQFAGGCSELAEPAAFRRLKDQLYKKEWVVYAKKPFAGPEQVFRYLGRYTHRVAISNQRLISVGPPGVTFATKDGKRCTLSPEEFIRRFLLHVLPAGFTKIRHYGLYGSSCVTTKLRQARRLLADRAPASPPLDAADLCSRLQAEDKDISALAFLELMLLLTRVDLSICPRCGIGRMRRAYIPSAAPTDVPRTVPSEDTS
jgi:hypothetical protein